MIKRVSDLTHLDWDRVWDMNVYLFFNYLLFDIENQKFEERGAQQWKATH